MEAEERAGNKKIKYYFIKKKKRKKNHECFWFILHLKVSFVSAVSNAVFKSVKINIR